MIKVLIVDDIHPVFLDTLKASGIDVAYHPEFSLKETLEVIGAYEGLVIRSKFYVDQTFLEKATKLKFIARAGAGLDNIDETSALSRGIRLINAPAGNRNAVGEHMLGMLLSLLNNIVRSHQEIRNGQWLREQNRGIEIHGKTVGIIGYGNNGQAFARCLQGMGVTVIAYDKYKVGFSDQYACEATMDEIFNQADVLSLHIPLTLETKNLVTKTYLENFQKPIFLLNGARGEIVNIPDLLGCLENGDVVGAALDVLPVESFPALQQQDWFYPLTSHPNVVLSAHIAGWTQESYIKIAEVLAVEITTFLKNNN